MSVKLEIRKATLADAPAVARMYARNEIECEDVPALFSGWKAYPLLAEFGEDFPLGWVLDDGSDVVGCIGNVPQVYDLGGRRILGAIAASWAVDPVARAKSLSLIMSFLRQPGVELLIDGSASPAASQILTAMKLSRMPIPDYGVPCFWAAKPQAFARAVLQRKKVPGAAVLSWPAGLLLGLRDALRGSGRGRISTTIDRVDGFDERWDGFWRKLSAGPVRLRSVRTRAVMEWKFGAEVRNRSASVLAATRGGDLTGYAVLLQRHMEETGMTVYDVADLQVLQDDPRTTQDLVRAAVGYAREDGVTAVKMLTGTPAKRGPLEGLKPYTYELPFWQLYYQAAKELRPALESREAWDFSPFELY